MAFLGLPAADSVHVESDRNVMLNAESSSRPREISIGLPGSDSGTQIFEDGVPLTLSGWPAYPYFHWVGGNSYSGQKLMGIGETALRSGSIGYAIDSYSKTGSDRLSGAFSASTSSFGLIRFDGNLSGSLGRGWHFSAGAYVNMDPTSVSTPSKRYVNDMKVLKASLAKRWDGGEASLLYKLSVNRDGTYGYGSGPFRYVGDGGIEAYGGFSLGHDCYFPEDDAVTFVDVYDGSLRSDRLSDMNDKVIHDATLRMGHGFGSGWTLRGNLHFSGSTHLENTGIYETGIDDVDGVGAVQNRLALLCDSDYADVMATVSMLRSGGRHDFEVGLGEWFEWQRLEASTFSFAHTVGANPERVTHGGGSTWDYNTSAEFNDGTQWLTSAYALDTYTPSDRLSLSGGLRLEVVDYKVSAAVNGEGETCNDRTDGFYILNGVARLREIADAKLNAVAVAKASYRLFGRFFLSAEYLYSRRNRSVGDYAHATMPLQSPAVNQLLRGGLLYDNTWLSLTSMLSYITGENNIGVLHLSKQIDGVSETISKTAVYDIGTFGWTTDCNLRFGNFGMHLLLTLQEPKYRDYTNTLTFSDGQTETLDYGGNYVTGISRVLAEIDPSYTYGRWRFSLSARYFSRQYASRVNNVWFNGHWETFASVGCKLSENLSLSVDAVNLLNQTGAKGSIDAADTITDDGLLRGLLISGTFIRPFTLGLTVNWNF